MYILRSATAYRLSDPLRSLSSLAIIHTYIQSDRSFCAWSPVVLSSLICPCRLRGEKTHTTTTMKRRTLLCLFPPASHHPKELCNFSKLATQISYSILISPYLSLFPSTYVSSLKLSSDAEIFPVFMIFCTIFSLLFLDGPVSRLKCKCPCLGLATMIHMYQIVRRLVPIRHLLVEARLTERTTPIQRAYMQSAMYLQYIHRSMKMHEIIEASVETSTSIVHTCMNRCNEETA